MKTFEIVYRLKGEMFSKRKGGTFQTLTHAKAHCRDVINHIENIDGYMITQPRGVAYDTREQGFVK